MGSRTSEQDSSARPSSGHQRRIALLLCLGLCLRFGVALTTANPDGMTLAWGSALMAAGHVDPYQQVVEHPEHDPIPVDQISAVSLAQGPIGVAAGAVPMAIARSLGLIEFDGQPDGTAFKLGELFAYKLSYLVPEALIVAALMVAVRRRHATADPVDIARSERAVVLAWAANPLIVFTWGQGMPDTWTVAVVCWAVVALALLATGDVASRYRTYLAVAALVPIGAFGTKLMPIIMMLPLAVVVTRDVELGRRRHRVAGAAVFGTLVGLMPYVVSRAARVNVFERFELNMLNTKPGVPTLHAMPDAQVSIVAGLAVTMWLMTRREPRSAVAPWTVAAVLSVAAISNIIPHLLFWAAAPLLVLAVWRPALGAAFSAASGVMIAWHLVSYSWLASLVARGLDGSRSITGQPFQWITQHVPAAPTVGAIATSSFVLVAAGAAVLFVRSTSFDLSDRTVRGLHVVAASLLVLGLGANVLFAESTGVNRWEFGQAGMSVPFPLTRATAYTTPTLEGEGAANRLWFRVDRTTHANADLIRVEILDRNENRLAMDEVPVWVAEPASEKVGASVSFPSVELDGVKVRFSRIAVGDLPEAPVVLAGSIASIGNPGPDQASQTDQRNAAPTQLPMVDADDPVTARSANPQSDALDIDERRTDGTADGRDGAGDAGGTPGMADSGVRAAQQVEGPIFVLREDRSGDIPGLLAGRLLGPAGWAAWVAAAGLGALGGFVISRPRRRAVA